MASSSDDTISALTEPLLREEQQQASDAARRKTCQRLEVPTAIEETGSNRDGGVNDGSPEEEPPQQFSTKTEIVEMLSLGFPLAVSFFCRMGMASTDSAFVGHIQDGQNSPEVYLAAAVLSDMILNICITPPLAFNQVLNGLVSQAVGSNNPKMAGIWLQQSMFWLAGTMLPCLTALFYVEPILGALGFPQDICKMAGTYAKYNVFWPVPNGLYQCMRFYFQARGLPRPAMYNNIFFLFVNAALNWFFVFGGPFQWEGLGFIGAAVSLSISRTMQGVCYYLYMFVYKKHHIGAWPEAGWSFSHHTKDRTKEFMTQSLPNIGTLLFQAFASQAQTVLVGRLGKLSIAASSALSTVTIPWSGTLSATTCMVSAIRVGYHLGRGDPQAAKRSSWIVIHFITVINVVMAGVFLFPYLRDKILTIATNDTEIIELARKLVPAMLVGTYLNLLVGNGTSGIFSGQGRPLIATILSFGLELPLSIGGVAIYILYFHGDLVGVYWWGAIAAGIEIAIVLYLIIASDWVKCADEARARQETSSGDDDENDGNDLEDGATSAATTSIVTSSSSEEEARSSYEEPQNEEVSDDDRGIIHRGTASRDLHVAATEEQAEETSAIINEARGPLAAAAGKKKAGKKKRRGKR